MAAEEVSRGMAFLLSPCGFGCGMAIGGTRPIISLNAECPDHGGKGGKVMANSDPDPMDEFEEDLKDPWAGGDEDGTIPAGN